jgi:aldose 1-epimerase
VQGPTAPSGKQIELVHADQRAVVVEVGGGLRAYSTAGRDLLDGYARDAPSTSGRGQVLAPWPNRLQDGSYEFDGRRHQLALTEPERHNAIHGLVRWAQWSVADRAPHRVVMGHTIHHQPGYPFSVELSIEYSLGEDGLRVQTSAKNVGREACPYGCGAHPYLTLGTATVDTLLLRVPGRTVLLSDERDLPDGSEHVDGTEYDFRRARAIGSTVLDNCFTDLERDEDGLARVVLRDPEGDEALTLWVDESYPYLMVFTGDPLPDVQRRSLAVEPMTCPANALRNGTSVIRLEPGGAFTSAWGIGRGDEERKSRHQ